MISRLGRQAVTLLALICMSMTLREAHSALLISGPAAGAPGGELTLSVILDAPLTGIDVDELMLTLDFDHALLTGTDATEGALLLGSLLTPNAVGGSAVASFLTTQSGLAAGVLATWKFKIDPLAPVPTLTFITPRLQTFVIDNDPTGDIAGEPFTIHVIPEPSLSMLLVAGLALLGMVRQSRPAA
jgi:hypothetical protein